MNSDLIQRDIRHQGVGAIVTEYNKQNLLRLTNKLHQIDLQNELTQTRIGADLDQALKYVKNVL